MAHVRRVVIWITVVFTSSSLHAATLTVDLNGSADHTDIQSAIDVAADGDTVLVKPGEYVITRSINFNRLHNPDVPPSPPVKNIVVKAEGGPSVTTLRMADVPEDPSRAGVVVFRSGETEESVLQGFTLTGGKGTHDEDEIPVGGALFCNYSDPTIKDCRISGNSAFLGGGGHFMESRSSLINCTISGNRAFSGAGIHEGDHSYLSLVNCTIAGNSSDGTGGGGGVYCDEYATLSLLSCIVWGNTGGSVVHSPWDEDGPLLYIEFSTIERIVMWPGSTNTDKDPLFCGWSTGEVWVDPLAAPGGDGALSRPFSDPRDAFRGYTLALSPDSPCRGTGKDGADMGSDTGRCEEAPGLTRTVHLAPGRYIYRDLELVNQVNLLGAGVDRTVIEGTVSDLRTDAVLADLTVTGGTGGGIVVATATSPEIRNCAIVGNTALDGGGIRCGHGASPRIMHCTITGNLAQYGVGGIYIDLHAAPRITSCIVWDNLGGSIHFEGDGGSPVIDHSCLEGDSLWPGEDNISSDPLFCGWGERKEVWVDPSSPGPGDGSEGRPFADVGDALEGFSPRLSAASPCLGSAANGEDMGSYPQACEVAGSTLTVRLAPGTYRAEDLNLVHKVSLVGAGTERTVIEGTVMTLRSGARLSDVTVTKGARSGIVVLPGESPLITRSRITGNEGGIDCMGSPIFDSCMISGNQAGLGGGAYITGSPRFVNCAFTGNSAFAGGAVYCGWPSDSIFVNCTMAGNIAQYEGGAISLSSSDKLTFILQNSIVWENWSGGTSGAIEFIPEAPPHVTYSCIQGETVLAGEGNTNQDPRFVENVWEDCADGSEEGCMPSTWNEGVPVVWRRWVSDIHLSPGSPARDAGTFLGAPQTDLDGKIRPCGSAVDMGVYEDCGGPVPFRRGDSNADGAADISDAVAILTDLFLGTQKSSCEKATDSNDDGAVDVSDAVFLLSYLFLGGKAPNEPLGSCGVDPTQDASTCESFTGCP